MRSHRRLLVGLCVLFLSLAWQTIPIPAQSTAPSSQSSAQIVDAIRFREIGPTAQGGRYVEFAVVESNPRIFYAATATGGLWKTVNNGISFTSVFDNQPDFALGAVALAQSRPDVVYVGTGESNNSRSTYGGNGVYKSVDAGKTWTKAGLPNAGRIGRIVVHPKNPDIVFVAASGRLYSENPDRGVYRSTDGGAHVDEDARSQGGRPRDRRDRHRDGSREPQAFSMPRPTTRCAGPGRSARAARAARSSSRPMAARPGAS